MRARPHTIHAASVFAGLGLVAALVAGCTEYEYAELRVYETFVQPDETFISDVLFVVDDSASMAEEQGRLSENFSAFVEIVQETRADFQLGIVTTDVTGAQAGVLRGGIFTPETPDLAMAVLAAFDVGTRGARDEQGLKAAVLATNHPANEGFLRPSATLHVIVLSDEDDHSPGDVETQLDALGNPSDAAVHGIVGDLPSGCASGSSAADAGARYLEAVAVTGGHRQSICADDYGELLTRVGLDVAGLADTFPLDRIPEPSTLEVSVDNVTIFEREVDGWHYSPAENAIVFTGRVIPRPGMKVAVTYELLLGADAPE